MRVIYYVQTATGLISLLAIYAKTTQENLPAHAIRLLKDQMAKP